MQPTYLLIGSGRVSRHLERYFRLLGLRTHSWSRKGDPGSLAELARASSHVLCLISDPAIEPFLRDHEALFSRKTVLHASGSLVTPLARGAHPLMTFTSAEPYDLDTYKTVPFVIERNGPAFADLLPGLPNPSFELDPALKPLYHAYCVMSGNFTTLLWQKVIAGFESRLGLPRDALFPYLARITENLRQDAERALTGPIARNDEETMQRHLHELDGDPYALVYRAFIAAARENPREHQGGRP